MTTEVELPEPQFVSPNRLVGDRRRRQRQGNLSQSILSEYYIKPDGYVAKGEGGATEQSIRKREVKGWQLVPRSPRVTVEAEHDAKFHALLRSPGGPAWFPPAQIVEYHWHKNAPRVFTCRRPLDDFDHPEHDRHECWTSITFPQLEGVAIYEASCVICKRYFATTKSQYEVEVLLKKHTEVAHREHLVNQELASGIGMALTKHGVASSGGGMSPEVIAQIAAQAAIAAVQQFMSVSPNPEPAQGDEPDAPTKRGKRAPDAAVGSSQVVGGNDDVGGENSHSP